MLNTPGLWKIRHKCRWDGGGGGGGGGRISFLSHPTRT